MNNNKVVADISDSLISPPEPPKVQCQYCKQQFPIEDTIYNELEEIYYCSEGCFESWATDNLFEVIEVYFNKYCK